MSKAATPVFPIQDVDTLTMAFGCGDGFKNLMPKWEEIPEEFRQWNPGQNKWVDFFDDWFYSGVENLKITPKAGVDSKKAIRHLRAIVGSFEPKHEHKAAAVAFLASLWFEDVTYTKREPRRTL